MEDVISFDFEASGVFVIKEDNSLWGWGGNGYKQLASTEEWKYDAPIFMKDNVHKAYLAGNRVYEIKEDGTVWTWGLLGNFTMGYDVFSIDDPQQLDTSVSGPIASVVSTGGSTAYNSVDYFVAEDGALYMRRFPSQLASRPISVIKSWTM